MNQEQTTKRLQEAQVLPFATIADLSYVPTGISSDALNEYLKKFTKPTGQCWLCETNLYINWGIAHGVAHCTNCGIDCRVYHYIEDESGKEQRVEVTLQYHPSNYSVNEE